MSVEKQSSLALALSTARENVRRRFVRHGCHPASAHGRRVCIERSSLSTKGLKDEECAVILVQDLVAAPFTRRQALSLL